MAKLGNTTLLSGQSYGNFTVGGTLTTLKIVAPDQDLMSEESNGVAFCSDGTLYDVGTAIKSALGNNVGNSFTPVYMLNGETTPCYIYGKSSTQQGVLAVSTDLDVDEKQCADVPTRLYRKTTANLGKVAGYISMECDNGCWEFGFKSAGSFPVQTVSSGGFFETSDVRKKTNFRDLDLNKCYEMIEKCLTVLFDWKDGSGKDLMGVIAQEVEEFFPEIVTTDSDGYKQVNYAKLAVVCMRVLKDLIDKVNG